MQVQNEFELINGGKSWRHVPSGRVLPVVRGGSDEGANPSGGDPDPAPTPPPAAPTPLTPPAPPAGDDGKQFTQADLDRLAGRRAAEAKKAAEKALAEQLGCTVEEAKAKLDALAQAEDAKKDELTRAQELAQAAQAEAEQAKAEAARIKREMAIDRKLVAAGVGSGHPADQRENVLTQARAALQLAADADDEAIDAEIKATVDLIPGLIAPQATPGQPPAPSGVTPGAKPPAGGHPNVSAIERGREKARARANGQPTPDHDPFAGFRTA